MPRNIVICCDGRSNQFGPTTTNVGRLAYVLTSDPETQLLHYAPGVGTLPEPGFVTWLGQRFSILCGLAFGAGMNDIVEECYSYLMNFWEKGDRVFIFGFSRGAYTARVLAAMLHSLGLLPRGNQNLVPYAMRLFQSTRSRKSLEIHDHEDTNYWRLCNQFRATFARPIPLEGHKDNRRFPVHFLGLWDTVSSVGWVWEPATFPFTRTNPSVHIVRHAISIDERRWFFRQNKLAPADNQDCQERWFAGSHGDVGGGYRDDQGRLWWNSFDWIISDAKETGLLLDDLRMNKMRKAAPVKPWLEPQHESLTWKWWPAEFFPKWQWDPTTRTRKLSVGFGGRRWIHPGAMIHSSVIQRIREESYVPGNLQQSFLDSVKALPIVPPAMAPR